jgi:hypothetical protein
MYMATLLMGHDRVSHFFGGGGGTAPSSASTTAAAYLGLPSIIYSQPFMTHIHLWMYKWHLWSRQKSLKYKSTIYIKNFDQRDLWDEDQGQYSSIHNEDRKSAHVMNCVYIL